MSDKQKYLVFVFLSGFLLFAANVSIWAESIKIGVLHWEGFPQAGMMKNSYQMALEKINLNGGVKGSPIELVYADDEGGRQSGEKAFVQLVDAGVKMVIGGYASSNTIFVARLADKYDMPFLICTAADDRITQRKWQNVFRLNPPASEYAKGLENFLAKKVQPETLAIVYENSPYGTSGAMQMMWFCRENDIRITTITPYFKQRLQPEYYERILTPLKDNPPEVIYMVSYLKDAVLLVKTLDKLNIKALLCGGAGGFTHRDFIAEAKSSGDKLVTATLWFPSTASPEAMEYYEAYTKRFSHEPDYHAVEAYSALMTAAEIIRIVDAPTPENIRTALNDLSFTTPFGPIGFRNYGDFERQNSLPTLVLQIQNAQFECVWPEDLKTQEFVSPFSNE